MIQELRDQILALEEAGKTLEPTGSRLEELTAKIVDYGHQYLNNVGTLKAYNKEFNVDNELNNQGFPEDGQDVNQLLKIIESNVDTPGINPASGNHLGYIPGGGVYPTALGDYLAAVTNQYSGVFYAGPGAVQMENLVIRWIAGMLGFPEGSLGNLTSGGSIANLIAIVTARDAKGISSKLVEDSCIYLTHQAHHSVQKAIRIAGLDDANLRYIKTDDYFRMDARQLESQIEQDVLDNKKPFLVIASAGTTDTGVVDPLDRIANICQAYNLWFHVDAAYGGFFTLVDELKDKFKGINRADSLTIDPHKGLFLAYGLGAVIVKDTEALQNSHNYMANYMQDAIGDSNEPSPADLSPELTKHFRGLRIWLPLQLFGVRPFRNALHEKHLLAQYFYHEVRKLGFETGPEPELSVCIYRFTAGLADPNQFNQNLIKRIQDDGEIFISSTTIDGVFWLRIAVLVFRTHLTAVDRLLELLKENRDDLLKLEE
jgi:aromatic-L-amino-acid decarboxylase